MFLKKKLESQVERIKLKLIKVNENDTYCQVYGSEKFGYKLNDVISMEELEETENKLGVTLPESFRVFLTQLGNGGAGPHGIYSLNFMLDEDKGNCVKNPCCIYPNMSKEYWNELLKHVDYADEEYDLCISKLHGGLLQIATTKGCEYDTYLVVTGEHAGRIVYTDDPCEDNPFFFTYEKNFLDWYERWLDEILLDYNTSWFGYVMGGDEFYLLDLFNNTHDQEEKMEAIRGFYKFKHISDSSYKKLESVAIENFETNESMCILATSVLASIDFNKTKNLLHKLLNSDNEEYIKTSAFIIRWEKEANIEGFSDEILKLFNSCNEIYINYAIDIIHRHKQEDISLFKDCVLNAFYNNKDENLYWKISELICELGLSSYELFENWLVSNSKILINYALRSLENVPYNKSYFETIKNLLLINDEEINQNILKYLGVIEDERLLLYYKNLWNKNEGHTLEFYVKYMQLFEDTLSNLNYPLNYFEDDGLLMELLEEFNINLQNENIIKIVNISCIKDLERVFIIYFLEDKSKCVAVYDYSGNFIFETKIEDTKAVPMYFIYDFTNIYVCALESDRNIDEELYTIYKSIFNIKLDERKLINTTRLWGGRYLSERERELIKLTL